ncbi:MazG-like family protein [Sphingobacterium sp. N143]|uniref:MazG-like family protein n=1 Tax=Sphingobacterium sp. N143 TaxID=2746727 RepID=UPI002578D88A|nr:MazG-like family protein [Sphingobacterium sp. N143]
MDKLFRQVSVIDREPEKYGYYDTNVGNIEYSPTNGWQWGIPNPDYWLEEISVNNSQENIAKECLSECDRQLDKWGVQNHNPLMWHAILGEEFGEVAKEVVEYSFDVSKIYRLKKMREELIQVAAVAISFVDSLDRNLLKSESEVNCD